MEEFTARIIEKFLDWALPVASFFIGFLIARYTAEQRREMK